MDMAACIGLYNFRAAFVVFSNRALDEICDRERMYDAAKEAVETNREWDNLSYFRKQMLIYDQQRTAWSEFFIARSVVFEAYYQDQVSDEIEKLRHELIETYRSISMLKSCIALKSVVD